MFLGFVLKEILSYLFIFFCVYVFIFVLDKDKIENV